MNWISMNCVNINWMDRVNSMGTVLRGFDLLPEIDELIVAWPASGSLNFSEI